MLKKIRLVLTEDYLVLLLGLGCPRWMFPQCLRPRCLLSRFTPHQLHNRGIVGKTLGPQMAVPTIFVGGVYPAMVQDSSVGGGAGVICLGVWPHGRSSGQSTGRSGKRRGGR